MKLLQMLLSKIAISAASSMETTAVAFVATIKLHLAIRTFSLSTIAIILILLVMVLSIITHQEAVRHWIWKP